APCRLVSGRVGSAKSVPSSSWHAGCNVEGYEHAPHQPVLQPNPHSRTLSLGSRPARTSRAAVTQPRPGGAQKRHGRARARTDLLAHRGTRDRAAPRRNAYVLLPACGAPFGG